MGPNPDLYRELNVPFEDATALESATIAFFEELGDLRKKHRLPNVYVLINASYRTPDDGPGGEIIVPMMYGDHERAELLAAWGLGYERSQRQELIAKTLAEAGRKRKK